MLSQQVDSDTATWRTTSPARQSSRTTSPSVTELVHSIVLHGASSFGTSLLKAKTLPKLQERLDDLSGAREFIQYHEYLCTAAAAHPETLNETKLVKSLEDMVGDLSDEYPIRELAHLLRISEDAICRVLQNGLREPKLPPMRLAQLMEHLATPSQYVTAMRGALRSAAAQLALVEVKYRDRSTPAWAVRALLKAACEGIREHLRLVAGMPGAQVPVDIVPRSERLDWTKLVERWEVLLAGVERIRLDAASSKKAVYFPVDPER